jgi:DNA topoisomerase-1
MRLYRRRPVARTIASQPGATVGDMVTSTEPGRVAARRARARAAVDAAVSPAAPAPPPAPPSDPVAAARFAGLRYVSDTRPGIRRRKVGRAVSYISATGERISDPEKLRWIRALAIPPAWTDVWISPFENGHILATGRDARGRKQYRYHPRWRDVRDETKYTRMIAFGELLPRIRERVDEDLSRPGLPREKVLAALVRLLELTFIRVGNEEYARLNRSFGLTTLRNRHVKVEGTRIRFKFRGKSGKVHEVGLKDRRLASLIRRVQELPGQDLFEYLDSDGTIQTVSSDDVNGYLREISGEDITAKDFRTWAGTVLTYRTLACLDAASSDTEAKRNLVAAIKTVSSRLGNTPAVCRRSYVHPGVLDAYLEGSLGDRLLRSAEQVGEAPPGTDPDEEAAVLELLRRRLLQPPGAAAAGATNAGGAADAANAASATNAA